MNASTPERVTEFTLSLAQAGFLTIRARMQGPVVILEGCVASFDAKCKNERIAAQAGLRIRNHLRITPAAFTSSPQTEVA